MMEKIKELMIEQNMILIYNKNSKFQNSKTENSKLKNTEWY